jgi:hypothetical protein
MEKNWKKIGPSLVGKFHFICCEMNNFYLNLGVYRMESFLKSTSDPAYGGSFKWGRPMVGHTMFGFAPPTRWGCSRRWLITSPATPPRARTRRGCATDRPRRFAKHRENIEGGISTTTSTSKGALRKHREFL